MPKKQKDKPPEGYFGGNYSGMTDEEKLRQKYPDLQDKYDLYQDSQRLILKIRNVKLKLNKNKTTISDYIYGTLKWIVGDDFHSKKYIKLQRLNHVITSASTRSSRRLYSYNVLAKLLME